MSEQTLTFVVGTGRSGSSALSRILRAHPDVLSLNELLASVGADPGRDPLPARPLSGVDFWYLLTEPNEVFDRMIRSGAPLPEFLYPRRPGRWSAERTGIPALCLMVLPHLTDDPDALLDRLEPQVTEWPTRPAADHYRALFRLLGAEHGSRAAVERSGYSLGWVARLHAAFPDARFVHLHRDGPDCALSMSSHPGYRMIIQLREIARYSGVATLSALTDAHVARLPPHLAGLLRNRFDPALVLERTLPVTDFGALWAQLVAEGVEALDRVPDGLRTALAYEDLLDRPREELARLAEHIGVAPDPAWLAEGAAALDGSRRGAALRLLPEQRAALVEACAPGTAALRAGAH
ncbi:sulfotransferase [Streptomyces sp. 549]|uniref:sulfotransferase family protein n=1 Tax=Streptomyces sp. 549 TaxID=3049076 RepID=UPI0024C2F511|nr:sulfotransferase [Streptomyces sp. 549]MDK1472137.1 sulfotransferase [Streptomyces sp. 549]